MNVPGSRSVPRGVLLGWGWLNTSFVLSDVHCEFPITSCSEQKLAGIFFLVLFHPHVIPIINFCRLSTENQKNQASCEVPKHMIFCEFRTKTSILQLIQTFANLTSVTFLMWPMQIEWSAENYSGLFKTQCLTFKRFMIQKQKHDNIWEAPLSCPLFACSSSL